MKKIIFVKSKKMKIKLILFCTIILALGSCKKECTPDKDVKNEAKVIEQVSPLIEENYSYDKANNIPIVLVHGLLGFGRDELLGFKYWGGLNDIQEDLKSKGYPCYTASVGAVSSNYDRAIELYYQIKGGWVDYGKFHSSEAGHLQKTNKYYQGLYPQWDAQHPIHLIGHSMGGQTIRVLIELLERGKLSERTDPLHATLFDGGKINWVESATTISTPNNGSTTTLVVQDFTQTIKDLVISIASLASLTSVDNFLYDFGLEQWGLKRMSGESTTTYMNRVFSSNIWRSTNKDLSVYDLSIDGAKALNNWVRTSSNVYYFSINHKATNTGLISGWQYPQISMNAALAPAAYPNAWPLPQGMGNIQRVTAGGTVVNSAWWANDGLVSVNSMRGPSNATIINYTNQTPVKGKFQAKSTLNGYDHLDMVGISTWAADVRPLYRSHAALINSCP
jgi:triacylglycerol lipase